MMADHTRLLLRGLPASHFPLRMSRLLLLNPMKFAFRLPTRAFVIPVSCFVFLKFDLVVSYVTHLWVALVDATGSTIQMPIHFLERILKELSLLFLAMKVQVLLSQSVKV